MNSPGVPVTWSELNIAMRGPVPQLDSMPRRTSESRLPMGSRKGRDQDGGAARNDETRDA
ncbi:MAG: hypothetical protein RJA70_2085 [Pseudomonadota bacterium]|jgi:hypothetical protein